MTFTASVMESLIYKKTGDEAASSKALGAALAVQQTHALKPGQDLTLDLTTACFAHNKEAEAKELIDTLVCNNHDSDALIQKAKQLF